MQLMMLRPRSTVMRMCVWFLFSGLLVANISTADEKDSLERDFSGELPRVAPRSPANALKSFKVAPGYRMELVAAEPLVADPVAMAFDADGRLFVVEMRGYPESPAENLGQVRLLVDTDGDGRVDKSHVYVDGLSWPTAVACWDGGVFVAAAPDVFYCKDTDGDHKADVRRKVFTGLGRGNVQGLVNTFRWGLDHRLHAATSSSGAELARVDGDKGMPLRLRGRDFAWNPRTLQLVATSGGGQHGWDWDDWATKFVCSNSNHIQQVMFADRYLARNPYLAVPSPRQMIAADGPQADVFRDSPVEPWRVVRTRLRKAGIVPGPVERGGKAAGYFTGSTGLTIYRGDAWPLADRGMAIVGDVGSNLIHRKRLTGLGLPFVAQRIDKQSELVTSTDVWFRPVQFANAPDGSLYVADMYREVIEHPKSLHPVIKKHLDLTSGRGRGRIYRLVPDKYTQLATPRLSKSDIAALVRNLDHSNRWHRETAARLIYQRQDRRSVPLLRELAVHGGRPQGRIQALYALEGLGALSADDLMGRLSDRHPHVRQHAVRLSESFASESSELRDKLFTMVTDGSLHVRYQLAFSLGELDGSSRLAALVDLIQRDGSDRSMVVAIVSSLQRGSGAVLSELVSDERFQKSPLRSVWVERLARQIGRQQRGDDVATLLRILATVSKTEPSLATTILKAIKAPPGSPLAQRVAAATGHRSGKLMADLLVQARQTSLDKKRKPADRVKAVHLLSLGRLSDEQETLARLLELGTYGDIQFAAIATLGTFDDKNVASLLVDHWSGFTPRQRAAAAEVLLSRRDWTAKLLAAVNERRVRIGDLPAARLRLLSQDDDTAMRTAATKILSRFAAPRRDLLVRAYKPALLAKGDAEVGEKIFSKQCAACHRVGEVGKAIGPNLLSVAARGADSLLVGVLDPNREVNPQYLSYVLTTKDGRSMSGMLTSETATSITLWRADNPPQTVRRIDIEQIESTGTSLMPEGFEKQIDVTAMADLLAFLLAGP